LRGTIQVCSTRLAVIGAVFAQGYGIAKTAPIENLGGSNIKPFRLPACLLKAAGHALKPFDIVGLRCANPTYVTLALAFTR